MFEKKQIDLTSPDISKLKVVVIDAKTRIYVQMDVDPEEARTKYWSHRPDMVPAK
jgi:hypothetical protein